jgi:hypothetical protein
MPISQVHRMYFASCLHYPVYVCATCNSNFMFFNNISFGWFGSLPKKTLLNFVTLLQYVLISHIYFTERKYSKLCELCDSKRECSQNLHENGNQEATLHCLTEGNGSVAYMENHYVQKYFRVSHLLFIFLLIKHYWEYISNRGG